MIHKIAFYAPLKSPRHPQPSGDRLIAQLLFRALQRAGYDVRLVCEFRSRDAHGNPSRQQRLIQLGEKLAGRLLRRWRRENYTPDLWFCYHNYYKAPDLIGPTIAEHLHIPYWVAEASWAEKRANGPWQKYHGALRHGLAMATGAVVLNPRDRLCLDRVLQTKAHKLELPVFLDLERISEPHSNQSRSHRGPAQLVAVAMLRPGDKLHSLVILAHALKQVDTPYQLHVIGDGQARLRAKSVFHGMPVSFTGLLEGSKLQQFLAQCDLLVWPAVNEAIGMALLEAQACGTPVLVGNEGGTSSVVSHGATGELVPPRDPQMFAHAITRLLNNRQLLNTYRRNARLYVQTTHSLTSAAKTLKKALD